MRIKLCAIINVIYLIIIRLSVKHVFKKKSTLRFLEKTVNHKVRGFACKNYPQIPQRHDRRVTRHSDKRSSKISTPWSCGNPPSTPTHTYTYTYGTLGSPWHTGTESASLNFNHKNALRIVPTVGGSENEGMVDDACCRQMDISRG